MSAPRVEKSFSEAAINELYRFPVSSFEKEALSFDNFSSSTALPSLSKPVFSRDDSNSADIFLIGLVIDAVNNLIMIIARIIDASKIAALKSRIK
jgi:hypothetical protein